MDKVFSLLYDLICSIIAPFGIYLLKGAEDGSTAIFGFFLVFGFMRLSNKILRMDQRWD